MARTRSRRPNASCWKKSSWWRRSGEQLFALWPSAGISAERHIFYLARGLAAGDRGDFALEHEEAEMELWWVGVDDLVDAVLDGRVTEEPISVAVLAYDALRRRGRL